MSNLTIQLAADTHKGMRRSGNEDAFAVFEIPGYDAAFAVCDGMGGLRAGDVASNEAIKVIEATLKTVLAAPSADPTQALREAMSRANDAVNAISRPYQQAENPTAGSAGSEPRVVDALMGTTAVVGLVKNGQITIAHAGDSRGYRYRSEHLARLTHDHSFVAEQVKLGTMTEAEARVSRFRNMITRAIGIDATVNPEIWQDTLQDGDLILVCTDGLTTMLDDEEIEPLLGRGSLEKQVSTLIDLTNRKGGHDNVTILLLSAGTSPNRRSAPVTPRSSPQPERPTSATPPPAPVRRRRPPVGTPPIVAAFALVGGLAVLGLFAMAASDSLRAVVGQRLTPAVTATPTPMLDYASLTYDDPTLFIESPLARPDQLAYQPGGRLAYILNSSSQVVSVRDRTTAPLVLEKDLTPSNRGPAEFGYKDDEVYMISDPQGNVYVAMPKRGTIKKFAVDGALITKIQTPRLPMPAALTIDEKGNLYCVSAYDNHIYILRAQPAKPKPAPSPKN